MPRPFWIGEEMKTKQRRTLTLVVPLIVLGSMGASQSWGANLTIVKAETGRNKGGTFTAADTFKAGEEVWVATHVKNTGKSSQSFEVEYTFVHEDGSKKTSTAEATVSADKTALKLISATFTGRGKVRLKVVLKQSGKSIEERNLSFTITK
jgi:hypothetical protein